MKAKPFILTGLGILALAFNAPAATNDISTLLQKGLFEEEANHNLDAAIQAYQAIVTQTDRDHQFAATAIFHLAECFRKQGKTNEAGLQYQRILRDFSDQKELVKLSQGYVGKAASAPDNLSAVNSTASSGAPDETAEVRRIQTMIKDSPDLINAIEASGATPLHAAAERNALTVAKFLLESKADTGRTAFDGRTPLHLAVENGHVEMVELLLANGADPNLATAGGPNGRRGLTPLHFAAAKGFKAVVETLLANQKTIVHARDTDGYTPLHDAAEHGFKAVAEVLLARGADKDAANNLGSTPLMVAAAHGNASVAELLIARGAAVNAKGNGGYTALIDAAMADKFELVKFLLARGAEVNARLEVGDSDERQHRTALHFAVLANHAEMVHLLLQSGADTSLRANAPKNGFWVLTRNATPLLLAAFLGEKEVAELLLAAKADVNANTEGGISPLMVAIQENKPDLAKLLIKAGAEVNGRDKRGDSPLGWAAQANGIVIAEFLLAHGADVNSAEENEVTPLHWAVIKQKAFADLLLQHGANVNATDRDGNTPLDWISRNPSVITEAPAIVALLREHGALSSTEVSTVRIARGGFSPIEVFRQDKNRRNRFTLLELIASAYGQGGRAPLQFPDFASLEISRLDGKGGTNRIKIDLQAALEGGDCGKDMALEWGDVVKIPELDHKVNEKWPGWTRVEVESLGKCLERKVKLVVKGQINEMMLNPSVSYVQTGQSNPFVNPGPPGNPALPRTSADSFWLSAVVRAANMLRASSDLTRVKVTRSSPKGDKPVEMLFNLDNLPPLTDLWLRDGDLIEVPEKP